MRLKRYPEKEEFLNLAGRGNLIPVCLDVLADMETPLSVLERIGDGSCPVFLLESVEGGERWGRYSFLGAAARCSVRVYKQTVEIEEDGIITAVPHKGDPLAVLRSVMARYKPVSLRGLPRFWGGMVGYFAYEFVSFFEAIPNACGEDDVLGQFIIPNELYIFDNVRHTLTLVTYAHLDGDQAPEAAFEKAAGTVEAMETRLAAPFKHRTVAPRSGCTLEPVHKGNVYCDQVSRIKEYIAAGDIIQTVLAQPFACEPSPDPVSLYRAQRYVNPSPYLFYLHLGKTILVGSSPEIMVRLEDGVATLRPIAGTRPRGKTEQEDRRLADELLQDPKERAEHLMLVDLGRNDLGRVSEIGSVQVTDLMVVERYSHVMHLVSNIVSDLRQEYDAWDLLRASFPAGTLSGAPKVRAMEIIAELEAEPRGPYGGAIGYISFTGNMDLAITIRTACIEDGRLTVRAGAGIVADSDPQSELVETINKAGAIRRALQLIAHADEH